MDKVLKNELIELMKKGKIIKVKGIMKNIVTGKRWGAAYWYYVENDYFVYEEKFGENEKITGDVYDFHVSELELQFDIGECEYEII